MKKLFKIIISAILIATLAVSMVGCGRVSEHTAKAIVNALVEQSYELNVIYFGQGLDMQATDNEDSLYVPVAGNSNYTTKLALVERTREIFSSDYASDIIDVAFKGGSGAYGSDAVFARYIEYDGHLCVRQDIESIEIAKYDFKTTEITKISKRFIRAKIKTTNTPKGEFVEIVLINEENGWRIDSATY